jgi:hypothetical protein
MRKSAQYSYLRYTKVDQIRPPRPTSMPLLPAPPLLNALIDRLTTDTTKALQVICAFPVSGQYGLGSRFLYVEIHYLSSRPQ